MIENFLYALQEQLKNQLFVADVTAFFSKRSWYEKIGIPWRRGYLLCGPPGTGKTSVAFALAGELRLNLC